MASHTTHDASHRTTREEFMANIRAALGRSDTPRAADMPAAPAVNESLARLGRPGMDVAAVWADRATQVGMKVQRLKAADVTKAILDILKGLSAKRVVVAVGTLPQAIGLKDSLRRNSIEVVDWQSSPGFGCQFDTDAGITDVHGAIAESGTFICCPDAGHSRGLSLVPPVHIAIVRRSDILPDMIDWWAKFKGVKNTDMPSSIAFITGPSKTADIEGILITGVHGPGTVHALVVDDA